MTTAIKLVLAQPLVAGSPPLVCQLMGDRMLHRRAFAQRGPSALGLHFGAQLVLELLILADGQAPAVPEPRGGALRAQGTRVTGTGRKLGVSPWDQRHRLALWTGDMPVRAVEGEVVRGAEGTAAGPGPGHDVPALRGPRRHPRAGPVAQVALQRQPARAFLPRRGQPLHGRRLRLGGWADAPLPGDVAVQIPGNVLLAAGAGFGAARAAVSHRLVLNG